MNKEEEAKGNTGQHEERRAFKRGEREKGEKENDD